MENKVFYRFIVYRYLIEIDQFDYAAELKGMRETILSVLVAYLH